MAAFFSLKRQSHLTVEMSFAAMTAAEEAREREHAAAEVLQAAARMMHDREVFQVQRAAAVTIQRIYRGYCGRRRYLDALIAAHEAERASIFAARATAIQRTFRGYLSRKYTSDFRAQRAYIARIDAKSNAVRRVALQARAAQEEAEALADLQQQRAEFEEAIRGKHHLLSTAVRPGVLRPPLAAEGATTIFGTDVEAELRAMPLPPRKFKSNLIPAATIASTQAGPSPCATTTTTGPLLPPMQFQVAPKPYERGVQAETPWGVETERARLERCVNRSLQLKQAGASPEATTGRGDGVAATRQVQQGAAYRQAQSLLVHSAPPARTLAPLDTGAAGGAHAARHGASAKVAPPPGAAPPQRTPPRGAFKALQGQLTAAHLPVGGFAVAK